MTVPIPLPTPDAATRPDYTGALRGAGSDLEIATLGALDRLEQALTLCPVADDCFEADNEESRFGRLFGGQLVAQAMTAASATVAGLTAHSIHASFVRSGASDVPVQIAVGRTRDGRSMSVRQVEVSQAGRTLLTATVSFDANPDVAHDDDVSIPEVEPESLPLLQHWAQQGPGSSNWIDVPPPLEMRIAEAPTFLGGAQATGTRAHWMRLPRTVDGGPGVHGALLGYASDYLLVDMAFRNHPEPVGYLTHTGLTLDHAVWLHRPVYFERWHRYTQQIVGIAGHRALVRGTIVDAAGRHVASTAQEVLVRPIAQ